MSEYTKEDHDRLVEIHTVLLGTNGQGGLARQVARNTKSIIKIWLLLAVLVATTGGGIYGIAELLIKTN